MSTARTALLIVVGGLLICSGCSASSDNVLNATEVDPPPAATSAMGDSGTAVEASNPTDEPLAFEAPELEGLCEEVFAESDVDVGGGALTETAAIESFVSANSILEGLRFFEGDILLDGEPVGHYRLLKLSDETFTVSSANWCYPD